MKVYLVYNVKNGYVEKVFDSLIKAKDYIEKQKYLLVYVEREVE